MKNCTKYVLLALLVATSGIDAQPISLSQRWNNWTFNNSRLGRFLGLAKAADVSTDGGCFNSAKKSFSSGLTKAKNSRVYGWFAAQAKSAGDAVTTVVDTVKTYPHAAAGLAGAVSYPVVKKLSKMFWNSKIQIKIMLAFPTTFLAVVACKTGVSMPQVSPYLAASVAGGFAGTGALDCLRGYFKNRTQKQVVN